MSSISWLHVAVSLWTASQVGRGHGQWIVRLDVLWRDLDWIRVVPGTKIQRPIAEFCADKQLQGVWHRHLVRVLDESDSPRISSLVLGHRYSLDWTGLEVFQCYTENLSYCLLNTHLQEQLVDELLVHSVREVAAVDRALVLIHFNSEMRPDVNKQI